MTSQDAAKYEQADAISLLIDHAEALQQTANGALAKISGTEAKLAGLPARIQEQVAAAVREGLAQPAENASDRMSEQLHEAIEAAKAAAGSMSKLERAINRKMTLTFLGLTALAAAVVTGVGCYIGVAPWQLDARRAELSELRASMERLHAAGADAYIQQCVDVHKKLHPCAAVDEHLGQFGEGLWVLKGR